MGLTGLAATVFLFLSWLIAVAWLWQAWGALHGMPSLPDLTAIDPETLPALRDTPNPHLTVIVPACNEQETIQASLRSLLGSTGIHLEILAVNDRSTDSTGELMRQVASEASASIHSLRVLEMKTLPEGWLGKPHAMATAASEAKAEWLLFTDGDVLFASETLALAVRHAERLRADHYILVPTLIVRSLAEQALQSAMQVLAQWSIRLWKVADPRAKDFIGVGGFNLIRRKVYRGVGGFESIPMEVLDDLRIGWKIKRAGFSQLVVLGPDLVRIRWIAGVLSVIGLVEKNGFAMFRFRTFLHVLASFGMAAVALVPLAAIVAGTTHLPGALWIGAGGWAAYAGIVLTYWANRRLMQAPAWLAVFFASCVALVWYAFMRSMVLALARGGIRWRGTYYPLATLREHCARW